MRDILHFGIMSAQSVNSVSQRSCKLQKLVAHRVPSESPRAARKRTRRRDRCSQNLLTDELTLRGHEGMLDDEMFLGHRMGSNHLDVPSFHCHLRRVSALLAGPPPGASLV